MILIVMLFKKLQARIKEESYLLNGLLKLKRPTVKWQKGVEYLKFEMRARKISYFLGSILWRQNNSNIWFLITSPNTDIAFVKLNCSSFVVDLQRVLTF